MSISDELIRDLEKVNAVDVDRSFEYAKVCSEYLRNPKMQGEGRKIVINVLDNWSKIAVPTREMWTDLIESAGFYPYLEKEKKELTFRNTSGEIRKEFHKSGNTNRYFHEEQKMLYDILIKSDWNLIVSAPTSFGKSLLTQEIVASRRYRNIVIIQPTLALIDETRRRLRKYKDYYKTIVRTTQRPSSQKGNLFLLTAERVMEYPEFPNIDFFVIDEFYKLSAKRDEERSDVLNNAFNLLISRHKSRFYLLGPNVDDISAGFAEKYHAQFLNTQYSLVDNRTIDRYAEDFGARDQRKANRENALFDLLLQLRHEQTIIYCSSPQRVRYLSRKFSDYLDKNHIEAEHDELSLVEWIRINVGEKWGLIDCLNHRIGTHDGSLPKHITSSIFDYFNQGKLNYLFCTTTIIEGVNTSAKNVVFFDRTKGIGKRIDFFDYSNIKGRSGRMMVHYVGRIFNFSRPPEREAVSIDIPFFDQKGVSDEVLINIDEKDVKDKESEQYKSLKSIPEEERELFKRNGVLIKGQRAILDVLKSDIRSKHRLLAWDDLPSYAQLDYVLGLAWDHLLKKGESKNRLSRRGVVKVTHDYTRYRDLSRMIMSRYRYYKFLEKDMGKTDQEIFDEAVTDTFQILRRWFHYKIPKWLNVMNSLQKYVCEKNGLKPGNYTYYSTQIENDFVPENLSILVEYGIPKSAIDKLEEKLPAGLDEESILDEIENKNLIETSGLIQYEKDKIMENIQESID